MIAHSWPGNLRELRNDIERAVIMARGSKVLPADLPGAMQSSFPVACDAARTDGALQTRAMVSLENLEESRIRGVLEQTTSMVEAAEVLGIDQATLYHKRKELDLE